MFGFFTVRENTEATEIELDIEVTGADTDPERLNQLTYQAVNDLRLIDAESVKRREGEPTPEGAKGDSIILGALALVAAPVMLPD